MQAKPLIGICPLYCAEKKYVWCWDNYLSLISNCGGIPVLLPMDLRSDIVHAAVDRMDGILILGGEDVSATRYRGKHPELDQSPCLQRDDLELAVFHYAHQKGVPIFGICRGIQLINVAMGGTLIEDIATLVGTTTEHRHITPTAPVSYHFVDVLLDTPLEKLTGEKHFEVNSYHHQALDRVANGLQVMARSSTDNVIEAVWAPQGSFVMALQWHPERIQDEKHPESHQIVRSFIAAASAFHEQRSAN